MKQVESVSAATAAYSARGRAETRCQSWQFCRRELVVAVAQTSPTKGKNQDRIFTFSSIVPSGTSSMTIAMLAIADGVGGLEDGGLASDIAISTASESVLRQVVLPSVTMNGISSRHGTIREVLATAMSQANHQVFEAGLGRNAKMCTTLTALLVVGASAHLVHAGDSRAYAIEASSIRQLTTDHSISARLADIGQEDGASGGRNVLYRALGAAPELEAQVSSFQLNGTTGFILCSDGLWSALDHSTIQQAATGSTRARAVCTALLAASSERLMDDASAIVAMFEQV